MPEVKWEVVPQTVTVKGVDTEVWVKVSSYFFTEDKETGKKVRMRMKWPCYELHVNIVGSKTPPMRIRYTNQFSVLYPDKLVPKTVTVGQGKTRRTALDRLTPELITKPGEVERFATWGLLRAYCVKRFGEQVTTTALHILSNAIKGV